MTTSSHDNKSEERRDFFLGPFLVDARGMRILKDDERLAADAQQCEILVALANAHPSIVSKIKLIETVWGGLYVTDAALHKSISSLRGMLRNHGAESDIIETRHRRGYQLAVKPVWVSDVPAVTHDLVPEQALVPSSSLHDVEPDPHPSPDEIPGGKRVVRWKWLAAIACLVAVSTAAVLFVRESPAPAPATEVPAPEEPDTAIQDEFPEVDFDGLIKRFRESVATQPELAKRLVQVMHLRASGSTDRLQLGLALKYDGVLAYYTGDTTQAGRAYASALRYLDEDRAQTERANVMSNLAVLLVETDQDLSRAEVLYKESLSIRARTGDRAGELGGRVNYVNLLIAQQRWDEAKAQIDLGLDLARELENVGHELNFELMRADLLRNTSSDDPLPVYERVLSLAQERGDATIAAALYQRMSQIFQQRGQFERAQEYIGRAIRSYETAGRSNELPVLLFNRGQIEHAQGRIATAEATFSEVAALLAPGSSAVRISALIELSSVKRMKSDPEWQALLSKAEAEAIVLNDPIALFDVYIERVPQLLEAGDAVTARHVLAQARQALDGRGDWQRLFNLRMLGLLSEISGERSVATVNEVNAMRKEAEERGEVAWQATLESLALLANASAGNTSDAIRQFNTSRRSQGLWLRQNVASAQPMPVPKDSGGPSWWWVWLMTGVVLGALPGLVARASNRNQTDHPALETGEGLDTARSLPARPDEVELQRAD